jgi:Ring finger domain
MSMSAALSQVFAFDRTRARFRSDRIDQHDEEPSAAISGAGGAAAAASSSSSSDRAISPPASPTMTRRSIRRGMNSASGGAASAASSVAAPTLSSETGPTTASSSTSAARGQHPLRIVVEPRFSPAVAAPSTHTSPTNSTSSTTSSGSSGAPPAGLSSASLSPGGDIETGTSPSGLGPVVFSAGAVPRATAVASSSTSLTLAELEEERELARRRSSLCILLASFVLFRLWVSAIQEGDFGLMLLCLVGTSWTARWISYNREREEELDRRIASYVENGQENGGGDPPGDRSELRMLSFQAQLALAIMESQRQMMQGGYGHPDGTGEAQPRGVSDAARALWTHLKFKAGGDDEDAAAGGTTAKAGYGSVSQKDKDSSHNDHDEPHCSICLCEYEDGEDMVKLPCGHLYHDECISSWTTNHVKCPLCNYDLETSARGGASIGGGSGGGVVAEIV